MAANTYDMNSIHTPVERNDMFAQSSALYGRINARKKSSPLLVIAPVAALALVGAVVLATSMPHPAREPAQAPAIRTTSVPAAPVTLAPVAKTAVTHKADIATRLERVASPAPRKTAAPIRSAIHASAPASTAASPAIPDASALPLTLAPSAPTQVVAAPVDPSPATPPVITTAPQT